MTGAAYTRTRWVILCEPIVNACQHRHTTSLNINLRLSTIGQLLLTDGMEGKGVGVGEAKREGERKNEIGPKLCNGKKRTKRTEIYPKRMSMSVLNAFPQYRAH